MKPQVIIKGIRTTTQSVKRAKANAKKAMDTAVRVRGFKLMRQLRKEIRAGAPGGAAFAPLSIAARTMDAYRSGRLGANKPLRGLARAIGYEVPRKDPLTMKIGFVGPASSTTWRKLAAKHQKGFTSSADEPVRFGMGYMPVRDYLRHWGSLVDHKRFGGKKTLRRNVLFLRKTTKSLRTPARRIIEPFNRAHRSEALAKIRRDFRLKMMGRRI